MSEIVEEFIEYEFDDEEDGEVEEVSSQEQEDGDADEGGIEIVEELLENSNDGVIEEYLPTEEVQNEYIDEQTHIIMEEDVEEDFEDDPEEADNIELQQQEEEETPSPQPPAKKKARTIQTVAGNVNNGCDKMPRRFLLYDMLVAEIVDYDNEDGAPIVEFSMSTNEREAKKLPVECGICPDVMPRSKLNAHIKTHLKPGTKRFNCIYCDENFVSRSYAAGHARRHMGIRPYVCAECKLYYCTKQDLKVHEQRRHLRKEHICEHCGKTFAQNTTLRSHVLLVHEQKRRFECEHCGKRFLRNYTKIKHVQNVHFGNRTLYDCPFCDKRFKDTHKLADHRKREHLSTQTLFECRECGLEFTSIDFFDAHRRSLQCRQKYKERYSHDTPTTIASATATIDSLNEENEESQDNIIEDNQQQQQIEQTEPVQVHEYVVHEYEVPEGVDPDHLIHLEAGQRFVLATDETLKQEEEYLYEITVDS